MTCWRVCARRLYELGGTATRAEFKDGFSVRGDDMGLRSLRYLGLATHSGRAYGVWALTQAGIDFCEGRLQYIAKSAAFFGRAPTKTPPVRRLRKERADGGATPISKEKIFAPTWIAVLPRGVKLVDPDMWQGFRFPTMPWDKRRANG